eukprot:TRINITY_DN10112_c0_g1_i1.p1 TRINITY_DN10112_c0_g1~~TRINITY_DN10112_c0_g1_i1.p1  ORF type:complete len:131 (+),score=35.08 TRINITY_DN10112_c0_g1_i1:60-452(+)
MCIRDRLNAVLGLSSYDGDLKVLGLDPSKDRDALMKDVCFIADVATLPKWMKVVEVLDFVEAVHPRFNREKAMNFLSRTKVPLERKVRAPRVEPRMEKYVAQVMGQMKVEVKDQVMRLSLIHISEPTRPY